MRLGTIPISIPHGFINRLLGISPGYGWGDWLLYQGTLVAIIAVALAILLVSSPANLRAVSLLAVPFALGAIIWLCSRVGSALPGSAGNAVTAPLLLILLAAMTVPLARHRSADPNASSPPAAPTDT